MAQGLRSLSMAERRCRLSNSPTPLD